MSDTCIHLVCIPCAGASATMYSRWQRLLPAWIRIIPLELPGRGSRIGENFVVDYDSLLTKLSREILPHTEKNWALFGHSMGALIAHGLLRYLQANNINLPQHLFHCSGLTVDIFLFASKSLRCFE